MLICDNHKKLDRSDVEALNALRMAGTTPTITLASGLEVDFDFELVLSPKNDQNLCHECNTEALALIDFPSLMKKAKKGPPPQQRPG